MAVLAIELLTQAVAVVAQVQLVEMLMLAPIMLVQQAATVEREQHQVFQVHR